MRLICLLFLFAYGDWKFDEYPKFDDLEGYYYKLAEESPNVQLVTKRFEDDSGEAWLLKLTSPMNSNKRAVFIDCGKYGSDWLAIASCHYMIDQLLKRDLLMDYWILPLFNPTGYVYSWRADRLWQKNTRDVSFICDGVFLDANYEKDFDPTGNPCSNTYPGERHTSEEETIFHIDMLREFTETYTNMDNIASISVMKWGGSIKVPAGADETVVELATKMATAASSSFTVDEVAFQTGSGSATISDKIAFAYEFHPRGDSAIHPENEILAAGEELLRAVDTLESHLFQCENGEQLIMGGGRGDITGSITMVNMMGFATPGQDASGMRGRLYSRAMYVRNCDPATKPFVFVSGDHGMGDWTFKSQVVQQLNKIGVHLDETQIILSGTGRSELIHMLDLLVISATLYSSSPARVQSMILCMVLSGKFSEIVLLFLDFTDIFLEINKSGTIDSILEARKHTNQRNAFVNVGRLDGANLNRSPSSYLANRQEDIDFYADEGDTDKNFTLLAFKDNDNNDVGSFNWFAQHPNAMNKSSTILDGDSKGWPSILLEDEGDMKVVAFAATNLGDVSPGIEGPKCHYYSYGTWYDESTEPPEGAFGGQECNFKHSTCPVGINSNNGESQHGCFSFGIGKSADKINGIENQLIDNDMKDSVDILVKRQVAMFNELINQNQIELGSEVNFRHKFINMAEWSGMNSENEIISTCKPALGVSFAAGCIDGHGAKMFIQGTNQKFVDDNYGEDWVWFRIRDAIVNKAMGEGNEPDPAEYDCHQPKPVLLPTGWVDVPYNWHPDTIELGLYQIGHFFLLSVPGEFTTMAGRYIREAVRQRIRQYADYDPVIVITGLSNTYTHYITTELEYDEQRYEAGSVIYGRNTLAAYTIEMEKMVDNIFLGEQVDDAGQPNQDLLQEQLECLQRPGEDTDFEGQPIGTVLEQPEDIEITSSDIERLEFQAQAKFVGGNPRNFLDWQRENDGAQNNDGYFAVEGLVDGNWVTHFHDFDWETELHWEHENFESFNMSPELMAEHKQLGPLALANYYVGLATDGYRYDLLAIRDFVDSGNKLQDIELSNFLRRIEKVGDCDVWGEGGDNTLNGYNIITLKLILNWQRELPPTGEYRFRYTAFIRQNDSVSRQTFFSDSFMITNLN